MVAKGADTARMMAELYAKRTGSCKGKGGSMHIADASVGVLGANGVVAGGLSVAAGVGLSIKQRRSGQVCLCFFGDGAANRGPFHEALNLVVIWKLPVIFLCENNGWASSTSHASACAVQDVAARAAGYGLRGVVVDGMDALAVYAAVREAADRARAGGGPALVEASGSAVALESAFQYLRKGGRCALVGLPSDPVRLNLGPDVVFKEATIIGIHGREMFRTWTRMLELLTCGLLIVEPVITHEMPLEQAEEALALLEAGKGGKVILVR